MGLAGASIWEPRHFRILTQDVGFAFQGVSVDHIHGCCSSSGALRARRDAVIEVGSGRNQLRPELRLILSLGPVPSREQVVGALTTALPQWRTNPKLATATLAALARQKLADVSLKVLEVMLANNIAVNVFHCNSVISACEKTGQWQPALNLLRGMHENKVLPDVISFNERMSMADGTEPFDSDTVQQAGSKRSQMMPDHRLQPDEICYNAAISASQSGGQWQVSMQLLTSMPKMFPSMPPSAPAKSSRSGNLPLAMPTIKILPDDISFGAAVSACEKAGQWKMVSMRVMPNQVCYNSAMSACSSGGQWQLVLSILTDMSEAASVSSGDISYDSAVRASERAIQLEPTLRLLSHMQHASILCFKSFYACILL
ncbi:unnamed protein product [Polarella glacialis]|uniref:Pentatricopeptide repeat-containing protein n=1 Tax=Polarella glacialis TaxID=89957 RepID=A0A813JS28_POLGL|nr:unnamed protein product [Polarella glacialis]